MKTFKQDAKNDSRTQDTARKIAMEIRDSGKAKGDTSASYLSKYFSLNTLRAMLSAVRAGEEIEIK